MKEIHTLFEYVGQQHSTFKLYPDIDELLEAKMLSVNSNYRGYGIAGKLVDRTMQYMRDHQIKVIQIVCSSHFSALVCKKMGFKMVYALSYVDYKVNGGNPILPAAPHKAVQIFVQEVH